jgi:hypothetical protein
MPSGADGISRPASRLSSPRLTSPRWVAGGLLLAAAEVTLSSFIPVEALRALLTLGPSLVLPGAALIFAASGFREPWDPLPTAALAVILSIAYYPLAAIAWYAAGGRLSTPAIAVLMDAWVLTMVVLGSLRLRLGRSAGPRPLLANIPASAGATRLWGSWLLGVVLAGAAVVGLGVVLLPKQEPSQYFALHFTSSWALASGPRSVPPGADLAVPLAVENAHPAGERLLLSATLDGKPFGNPRVLSLRAGGSWTGVLDGALATPGCLQQLVVSLSRPGSSGRLLSINMWISLRAPSCPG